MKTKQYIILAPALAATILLAACGGESEPIATAETEHGIEADHEGHDNHEGHDHASHEAHDDHEGHDDHDDHDHASHGDHGDHEGHDHSGHGDHVKAPGPNGGRIIEEIEPHLELLITGDNKLRITQLDDENKAIPMGAQELSAVLGERAAPTSLTFSRDGDTLLSNQVIPDGDMNPIVLSVKESADASETHRIKFVLNLADCPTCDYLEYACICDHDHDHDH